MSESLEARPQREKELSRGHKWGSPQADLPHRKNG